jgi:DNA polymerase-1
VIAWDTETRSFRWWENPAFLASWALPGSPGATTPLDSPGQVAKLAVVLAGQDDRHLVGANSKFDAHMTREVSGGKIDVLDGSWRVDDVLTMSRLINGNRIPYHGLKELSVAFIDPSADEGEKEMVKRYYELTGRTDMAHDDSFFITWQDEAGKAIVEKYAAQDAELTMGLYDFFTPQLDADPKLRNLYDNVELPIQKVLYDAETRGVAIDQEQVVRLQGVYDTREQEARGVLENTLGFVPEGEGSSERLRERLPEIGVELTERTEKSGELAVNRKALAPFADHPAVAALFEWRRVNKFRTTYLGPLHDRSVVHTNFKQAEAWTGRMAWSQPNLQNLPKRTEKSLEADLRVRSVFVPRPGMEFVVADYESIEVKILAYHLGLPEYRELVAHGDPHAITAAAAWGGNPSSYWKDTPQRWLRDIAKAVTYGIVYGGGGPVVRDTINAAVLEAGRPEFCVDLDQARAIRRKITESIPGFKAFTASPYKGKSYPRGALYEQLMASQDGDYGYVRTLGGRKQWIKLEKAYVALSGVIQGGAADIMKLGAINVAEALKPHGAYPLLFVHDELVVECEKGQGQELGPVIADAMVSAFPLNPPLTVEWTVTDRSYGHA